MILESNRYRRDVNFNSLQKPIGNEELVQIVKRQYLRQIQSGSFNKKTATTDTRGYIN